MMPLALQDFGTTFLGRKTLAATNEEHLMKEKPSIQTTKKNHIHVKNYKLKSSKRLNNRFQDFNGIVLKISLFFDQ